MPKISVIIPYYNAGKYLGEAIESVLNQTFQDFEIIVVDDGSDESPQSILAKIGDEQIRLYSQENQGAAGARNTAISHASGEYLVFLDADDLLLPEKLERQQVFLDTNPDVGVVFSRVQTFSDGQVKRGLVPPKAHRMVSISDDGIAARVLAVENIGAIHGAMVRRSAVDAVGGFTHEKYIFEDWDLWFRMLGKEKFAFVDEVVGLYRISPESYSGNPENMRKSAVRLQELIEKSSYFHGFSKKERADYYLKWGNAWLGFMDRSRATLHFRKSISLNRNNFYPWAALILTAIFGVSARAFSDFGRKFIK